MPLNYTPIETISSRSPLHVTRYVGAPLAGALLLGALPPGALPLLPPHRSKKFALAFPHLSLSQKLSCRQTLVAGWPLLHDLADCRHVQSHPDPSRFA